MREIQFSEITAALRDLTISANTYLRRDVSDAFARAIEQEVSPTDNDILEKLFENARIIRGEGIPSLVGFVRSSHDIVTPYGIRG
jgi:fumarate hydratase subunit alpha